MAGWAAEGRAAGQWPTWPEWLVEEREERRKAKLEALRAEIQKGFDSGPAEEVDLAEWIESIKAQGRQRLAARKRAE